MIVSVFVQLLACKPEVVPETIYFERAETRSATQIQAIANNYTDNLTIMAKVTDAYGFAIGGEQVQFTLDADGTSYNVQTDSFGIAALDLSASHPNATGMSATATWNSMETKVESVLRPSSLAITSYPAQHVPTDGLGDFAAKVTNGSIVVYGADIWWLHNDMGVFAQHIASLPSAVWGVVPGHIDNDGILDVAVWTEKTVYLLRGHREGQFTLGAEYSVMDPESIMVDVSIAQLDAGIRSDVAMATSTETTSEVTVLEGDGVWNFHMREELKQAYPIDTMIACDENDDGWTDVNLINDTDGSLRRQTYSSEGWVGGFPSIIDPSFYSALPNTEFAPCEDLNGDGAKDILLYGGEGSSSQDMVFFIIADVMTKHDQHYEPYNATAFDWDGNGSTDIFALSEEHLYLTYYNQTTNAFSVQTHTAIPKSGPLLYGDYNNDGLWDLRTLVEYPIELQGGLTNDERWNLNIIRWKEDTDVAVTDNHLVVEDLDNDGTVEVVGIIEEGGQSKIRIWRYADDLNNLADVYTFSLGASTVSELKVWKDDIFVIYDNGSDKLLRQMVFNADDTLSTKRSTSIEQDHLSCADAGGQSRFLVWGGQDTYAVLQQNFTVIDSGTVADWVDADIGPGTNGQQDSIFGCTEQRCAVEFADLDGNGAEEMLVRNSTGITLTGFAEDIVLSVDGDITTQDLNGDGTEELIVQVPDSGWVWIYQFHQGMIANIQGLWIENPVNSMPKFADVNGDGVLEVMILSDSQTLQTSARLNR